VISSRANSLKIGFAGSQKARRRALQGHRAAPRDKRGEHGIVRIRPEHRVVTERSYQSMPGPVLRLNNKALRDLDDRVRCLSSDQLLERFHCLIGQRLNEPLKLLEALELDRIDARLDSEDRAEMDRVSEFQEAWALERSELLSSIERLVARLKAE
jgi:hypothetical protein